MQDVVLVEVTKVVDDSTGIWSMDELEFGVTGHCDRLRWLADACEKEQPPFGENIPEGWDQGGAKCRRRTRLLQYRLRQSMNVDETILFYSKHGNRAWKRFLNAVDAGADTDAENGDVLHSNFCTDCCVLLSTRQLATQANNPDAITRIYANWFLYQRRLIDQKYREWS